MPTRPQQSRNALYGVILITTDWALADRNSLTWLGVKGCHPSVFLFRVQIFLGTYVVSLNRHEILYLLSPKISAVSKNIYCLQKISSVSLVSKAIHLFLR